MPPPRPAASKITDVTVYQGQALVTREVSVPEGDGTVELVVTPLPSQTVDSSLYTEGTDGLRVLSTRFRTRAIKEDTRQEVRAKQELIKKLQADAQRLQKEIAVQQEDLGYLQKLGGFTGTALTGLTEKGRLDSEAIVALSKFVMENRGTKTKTETDLRQQLQANTEATEFATRQLAELSAGTSRVERDAVIVVHKARPQAGTVRLGYLVSSATWRPQYRLRGGAGDAPVRLEYLAAVVQQTGESWPGVRVTLSTARPSLDAAPPELLPLKMAVAGDTDSGPIDAHDDKSQKLIEKLGESVPMSFNEDTPLEDVLKYVKQATKTSAFPDGIPIYVDPIGLQEAEKSMTSTVRNMDLSGVPLKVTLKLLLNQLDLTYKVKDGLLTITSNESADAGRSATKTASSGAWAAWAAGWVSRSSKPRHPAARGSISEAATDQAEELRVVDRHGPDSSADGKRCPQRHVRRRGPARYPLAPRSAVTRSRARRPGGGLFRQGRARADSARLSAGQADQQERTSCSCLARRRCMSAPISWAGCACRSWPRASRSSPASASIRSFR